MKFKINNTYFYVMTFVFAVFVSSSAISSTAGGRLVDEQETISVVLKSSYHLDDDKLVYVGEDDRGRRYPIHAGHIKFNINNGELKILNIFEREGSWYIHDPLAAQ